MDQRLRPGISEPVILMFSRRQVETCDIDEPVQFLRRLTADRHTALEFCGWISLVIDGYTPVNALHATSIRMCDSFFWNSASA